MLGVGLGPPDDDDDDAEDDDDDDDDDDNDDDCQWPAATRLCNQCPNPCPGDGPPDDDKDDDDAVDNDDDDGDDGDRQPPGWVINPSTLRCSLSWLSENRPSEN